MKLRGIVSNQGAFPSAPCTRLISEPTGQYGNRYSTCRNIISQLLCASYTINQLNIQNKFHGCLQTFSVHHALSCSNGGLVIARHNGIHDEIIYLARQACSPNYVCSEDLIRQVRSRSDGKVRHGGSIPEHRVVGQYGAYGRARHKR